MLVVCQFLNFNSAKAKKMWIERVNLKHTLEKYRDSQISEEDILEQVKSLLKSREDKDQQILERLRNGGPPEENHFEFDLLQSSRIFHITHIENICVTYRLRFLDTKFFKGPLPPQVFIEIKDLEQRHQLSLQGFRIMAPSKNFRLENADDPMLFAPIGNGYYYLIHKWGNDLSPFRKALMWPLKNIENLLIFTVIFSFLITFVLRELFFSQYSSTSEFIMLLMFTFKSMVGLLVFYGVALGKNFSSGIWNSKYFNS